MSELCRWYRSMAELCRWCGSMADYADDADHISLFKKGEHGWAMQMMWVMMICPLRKRGKLLSYADDAGHIFPLKKGENCWVMQMMRVTFPPQPFMEQNVCPSHIRKKLQEADVIPHCLRIPNSPAHFSTQITWYWVQINKNKKMKVAMKMTTLIMIIYKTGCSIPL